MLTLAYGFGAMVQGDVLLDHSAVSVFRGEVLDRHISYGNRKPITHAGSVATARCGGRRHGDARRR